MNIVSGARNVCALVLGAGVALALAACQTPAETTSPPMSSAERWRHAEAALVAAFIERGDVVGAARAEDFIFQMSHGQAGRPMPSLESLPEAAPPVSAPPPSADIQCTSRLSLDGQRLTTDCR